MHSSIFLIFWESQGRTGSGKAVREFRSSMLLAGAEEAAEKLDPSVAKAIFDSIGLMWGFETPASLRIALFRRL
jgi:hypothetical protein